MFGILDYGLGNIKSISNMLNHLNLEYIFVSSDEDFSRVSKLILPGIGSFDVAMQYLISKGFISHIKNFVLNPKNFLIGICLGMQLLGNKSEEGKLLGLGLIDFDVESLKSYTNNNIPHMGWSEITKQGIDFRTNNFDKYYFVHSYFVPLSNIQSNYDSIMICDYGFKFSAGIRKNNIFGFQFHPEKSHEFGMHLFNYLSKL
jgi:glutamine amidotransferase